MKIYYKDLFKDLRYRFPFKVTFDELMMAYVDVMYELTQGGRVYSDLYLYNIGYGATLPEEPGNYRELLWTDDVGNLMTLSHSHSGIFVIYTRDKRWIYVFSSCRMEETVRKYVCQLKLGTHNNRRLQHYYDIEKGDLEIDVLEFCPKRFLKIARRKWCKHYGQSIDYRHNPVNKNFREEDYL